MYTHVRRADYVHVLECDASDHALGAIAVTAPQSSFVGACFRRRLREKEAQWGSLLRKVAGYRDAVFTPARLVPLRGTVVEVVGDAQSAACVSPTEAVRSSTSVRACSSTKRRS